MAIDSACSSSLMAVHQGCVALRAGEADTVIAAGANLLLTPSLSIFYTQAGLSAPDGRCKPFGQGADGIGRGEGVAAVVLRRLDDAIADGQPIYAVVRSSVANHDGRSNGITAPNRRSQVELMRRALTLAEVQAEQIGFVEAHGTGTFLGDMIEANALGDVHKTRGGEPCLLGSVKGNIGHTEGSAGIAAFIKVCLALHHRVLPPTVFGDSANPGLRLDAQGLRLADECAAVACARGAGCGELIRTGRQQRARGAGVGAPRSTTRPRCDRCSHALSAVRGCIAAQRRFDRSRAARPRRSAVGLLVPHHQRREAIAASSPCAGRQPRRTARGATGVPCRRPRRPGVVRPDSQGPGWSRAPVLGAGDAVPAHDAAALRRQPRLP